VKLVISHAHQGLMAAASKVLSATWQCCKVDFLGNALPDAGKGQRQMLLAAINTAFAQETHEAAVAHWRIVADQLRDKFPNLGALMAEAEVLSYLAFPKAHRTQIHSTNPLG
jgi:putative transposase